MSVESAKHLRKISEICAKNERDIRRRVKERDKVMDLEEKFKRDNNIPYTPYTRWKLKSSLTFLFYPIFRALIQVVVFIAVSVVGIAVLIWLIQAL
jgi:hypothetical protein